MTESNVVSTKDVDPVSIYFKQVNKHKLIDKDQEIYLAKQIEEAKYEIKKLLASTTIARKEICIAFELILQDEIKWRELIDVSKKWALNKRQIEGKLEKVSIPELEKKYANEHSLILEELSDLFYSDDGGNYQDYTTKEQRISELIMSLELEQSFIDDVFEKVIGVNKRIKAIELDLFKSIKDFGVSKNAFSAYVSETQCISDPTNYFSELNGIVPDEFKSFQNEIISSYEELGVTPNSSVAVFIKLLRKYQVQQNDAKNQMLHANLRLVVKTAKRFMKMGAHNKLNDLIQEGNIGLIKAVDKFDYHLGFKFSTYAVWWIRQSIQRSIIENGRTIRIPNHIMDTVSRINQFQDERERKGLNKLSLAEASKELDIGMDKIVFALESVSEPSSIHAPVSNGEDGDNSTQGDFIEDDNLVASDEIIEQQDLKDQVDEALKSLSPREERVLRMRYGIGIENEHTLEEVGYQFKVTRERARQIEAKAIGKLKHPSKNKNFAEYA